MKKFKNKCDQNKIDLYIANNIKILFLLRVNNFYISAYNKKRYSHLKLINKKINIIGSAHNYFEISEKIQQGCNQVILSRIFKTTYKNKTDYLGKIRFNLLSRKFSAKFVALGGINQNNFSHIQNLNILGCALSSDKKKAGKYIPAFFKK